jgi:hypothetical protein
VAPGCQNLSKIYGVYLFAGSMKTYSKTGRVISMPAARRDFWDRLQLPRFHIPENCSCPMPLVELRRISTRVEA